MEYSPKYTKVINKQTAALTGDGSDPRGTNLNAESDDHTFFKTFFSFPDKSRKSTCGV